MRLTTITLALAALAAASQANASEWHDIQHAETELRARFVFVEEWQTLPADTRQSLGRYYLVTAKGGPKLAGACEEFATGVVALGKAMGYDSAGIYHTAPRHVSACFDAWCIDHQGDPFRLSDRPGARPALPHAERVALALARNPGPAYSADVVSAREETAAQCMQLPHAPNNADGSTATDTPRANCLRRLIAGSK